MAEEDGGLALHAMPPHTPWVLACISHASRERRVCMLYRSQLHTPNATLVKQADSDGESEEIDDGYVVCTEAHTPFLPSVFDLSELCWAFVSNSLTSAPHVHPLSFTHL